MHSDLQPTIDYVRTTNLILGDKWTPQLLLCIAEHGSLRFCELQATSGGINPRTLSARLAHLENNGILTRDDGDNPHRPNYRLTKKGEDLLPIIEAMASWGTKYAGASESLKRA